MSSVRQVVEVIAEIDAPNVALQYDLFHAQQTDGDITNLTARVAPLIGHVQIASVPDRREPDHGELHRPWALAELDCRYDGWIGCEPISAGDTIAGLG